MPAAPTAPTPRSRKHRGNTTMQRKIRIVSGDTEGTAQLNDTPTAEKIFSALPIRSEARRWGAEIYFSIPVDAVGAAGMSRSGLFIYLQTSNHKAPSAFDASLRKMITVIGRTSSRTAGEDVEDAIVPWVEVNREHFQSAAALILAMLSAIPDTTVRSIRWFDSLLRRVSGQGNHIIHNFLSVLATVLVLALACAAALQIVLTLVG